MNRGRPAITKVLGLGLGLLLWRTFGMEDRNLKNQPDSFKWMSSLSTLDVVCLFSRASNDKSVPVSWSVSWVSCCPAESRLAGRL